MSYDLVIFHRAVKQKVDEGLALDAFDHPPLDARDIGKFLERLPRYEYEPESETLQRRVFVKRVAGCPIQVAVYDTEISFSVPFWQNAEAAIFEALQDASELSDADDLALFNPQTGEWVL